MNILKPLLALLLLGTTPLLAQYSSYSFRVEISGVDAGGFAEVSGLGTEITVVEYRNGTEPLIRKVPGATKYSNVTLKRGLLSTSLLNEWLDSVKSGSPEFRKTMSIILEDAETGEELKRYNCFNCWPTKWRLSPLESDGPTTLTEEFVIAIEWFEEA